MKSKKTLVILALITFLVTLFNIIGIVGDTFFYSIQEVPQGKKVATYKSAVSDDRVDVYLIENPKGDAIRCEAVSGDKSRNIYWEVGGAVPTVAWVDKTIVYINGKSLDIHKSKFDSRDVNEKLDRHLEERYTVNQ